MNKKVSRILLLLLALLSAVSIANATEQREAQRKTGLSFSGTTAYCYANCKSDNHEDKVTANVMLYQGSNVILFFLFLFFPIYVSGTTRAERSDPP